MAKKPKPRLPGIIKPPRPFGLARETFSVPSSFFGPLPNEEAAAVEGRVSRWNKERAERESFERLKAELALAFAAPDDTFHPLSVSQVIARNKSQPDA